MTRILHSVLLALLLLPAAGAAAPRVVVIGAEGAPQFDEAARRFKTVLRERKGLIVSSATLESAEAGATRAGDLLVPLGTEATRWALENRGTRRVVFAMVLNPVPGLVPSFATPPPGVTGACLDVEARLIARRVLPLLAGTRRVGIPVGPSRGGAARREIEAALREAGLGVDVIEVESEAGLEHALEVLLPRIDLLWSIPDPLVFSELGAPRVLEQALGRRVPVLGFSRPMAIAGAPLAVVPEFADCGEQAAELVLKVLSAKEGASFPIVRPRKVMLIGNRRILRLLGRPATASAGSGVEEWLH